MLDHGFTYELPDGNAPIIKVIGVGGGGSNAVQHMVAMGVKDVEFAICNTDRQALISSNVQTKLKLGTGLEGAGMDVEVGRKAALESIDELRNLLGGSIKMVFITAGMGGGTGTGAAPVVAEVAREMGLLTVAVVTAPYKYEGIDKRQQAAEGIELLKKSCDTVLVVMNDKLADLYGKLSIRKAFAHADNVLATAVKSIAEVITTRGDVNTDFMDVKKVLQEAGPSVMGSADAEGEDRALKAIQEALNSPLLNDSDIVGAKRILLTISSSSEYEATLEEQTVISNYIVEKIGEEARLFKIGAIFDDTLGGRMRVTIIAAGFETANFVETLPPVAVAPVEEPGTSAELVVDKPEQKLVEKVQTAELIADDVDARTPTFTHVGPTTLPLAGGYANGLSGVGYGSDNRISLNPTRQEDPEEIKQLINDFLNNRFSERELEAPAFSRHRVMLHEMPLLPDHEIIRTRLFD
ncbi:cell division protein FtsZ [Fibrella forsythiae]|uniref:Cell division protein FtsZ n=1 Tax=Fibrella forsythiae TaxID=2817061 RepID=A0ABS3JKD5_9BACT|nr:cell division protein FtsZ [Fibrella forsythiae]